MGCNPQGVLDLGDGVASAQMSLLEDPEVELGDLATVAFVERGGLHTANAAGVPCLAAFGEACICCWPG